MSFELEDLDAIPPEAIPSGIGRWRRVFELAPDMLERDYAEDTKITVPQGLLLTLLHPAHRGRVLDKGDGDVAAECADILDYHQRDHDADGDPADVLGIGIFVGDLATIRFYIEAADREGFIEPLLACAEGAAFWDDAPPGERADAAAPA